MVFICLTNYKPFDTDAREDTYEFISFELQNNKGLPIQIRAQTQTENE